MMKNSPWRSTLLFLLISFLYWYLLCFYDRSVFLLKNWASIGDLSAIFQAYARGLKMDLSLIGYVLVIPFLTYIIQIFIIKKPFSSWLLRIYTFVPTFLFAAISMVNLQLYEAWGEKLSKRAVTLGLGTIEGVTSSIDAGMIGQSILVLIGFFTLAHYSYHLLVVKAAVYRPQPWWSGLLTFILGAVLIFTCIRGGYGRATMNPSTVYFSENAVENHLAVNTYWAFLKDMTKGSKKNPYQFMDDKEAERLVSSVLPLVSDTIPTLSKVERPNVVLVLLEGMVAEVFEELGGEKGVTPYMKDLMHEGLNFTQAYAAADRSDKGMIAVMSGFPAQGSESIIQHIPKHEKLPGIGQIYDSLGYKTSFYHGGQSEFYNFKSYMYTHGIQKVIDNADFGIDAKRNSWGVYDHVVASRMLTDLQKEKEPFFSIFYTLVNHEPFDLEGGYQFGNDTKGNAYRSTCFYTDSMLHTFVEQAKEQTWYAHTIFLVVSDHGSIQPTSQYGLDHPKRFHIPLFIFGGALKDEYRGKRMENVVSQVDVASTLWHLISTDSSPFKYSNHLLAKNRSHVAFYNSNNTFGVVTSEQTVGYDLLGQKVTYKDPEQLPVVDRLQLAKAYFQLVFKDFQKY